MQISHWMRVVVKPGLLGPCPGALFVNGPNKRYIARPAPTCHCEEFEVFACHVDCYPWDVLDEGIEDVLERLQDQVGATGVTLAVAGDELEQFRPVL